MPKIIYIHKYLCMLVNIMMLTLFSSVIYAEEHPTISGAHWGPSYEIGEPKNIIDSLKKINISTISKEPSGLAQQICTLYPSSGAFFVDDFQFRLVLMLE